MKIMKMKKKYSSFQLKKVIPSLFNKKISGKNKLMAAEIVLYIISPFDFIPDFIPLAGYADDVVLPILMIVIDKLLSDKKESEIMQTTEDIK